jgi:hypothetical protein
MTSPRALSLLLLLLTACDSPDSDPEMDLAELYRYAVEDASMPEADEIDDALVAINDDNAELVRDDEGRVLMVTWTSYDGYDGLIGQPTTLGVEVWTSVAPQMQEFCRLQSELAEPELVLRLEQLLGLPAGGGKDRVVELWVPPAAMFRPAPDPEIDDSSAGLDFPAGVSEAHRAWIEDLRASSYGDPGYPWTQLGYTYDWSGESGEIGLSEFVVAKGSEVVVKDVASIAEYCD